MVKVLRMWHGRVPTEKASAYREFLERTAIPDYQSVDGCLSVRILERADGDVTHFVTMTEWESREHIVRFAGEDIEVAKYYPEDERYLLEFEPNVVHYDIVAQAE